MTKIIRKRNKLGQFTKASPWKSFVFIKKIEKFIIFYNNFCTNNYFLLKKKYIKILIFLKFLYIQTRKFARIFIAIILIIGLNSSGFLTISHTLSFYNDTEISNNNIFTAGKLDFILNETEWIPTENEIGLEAGGSILKEITIAENLSIGTSIDFKYIVTLEKTRGDNDFCNMLQIEASLDGILQYSGSLFDFFSKTTTFNPTTDNNWVFNISLPANSPKFLDKSCQFDFVFLGWQIELLNENEGYYDIESSSNTIKYPITSFNPNICPFEETPGRHIVYFNNQILRSDTTLADANDGPVVDFIPAGTYDITLASYDEHLSKPKQIQPHEQWKLLMKNALGIEVAVTNPIRDIVDATEEQVVEKVADDFSIPEDINLLVALHNAYPNKSNANSLRALCAMFEGKNLLDVKGLIDPPDGRVKDGLLALYTFEEDSGQIVQDVSGFNVPLNLFIPDLSKISRVPGGLSIDSSTLISSFVPALKLTNRLKETNEITIEAWIKPANNSQGGPARIATLSKNHDWRNFTLAQEIDKYTGRLRTPITGLNGVNSPGPIFTPPETANTALQHIVYTRTSDIAKIYIDGVEVVSQAITGDFSNWDSSFRFGLANEFTMERTWLGELHLIAIYDHDLSGLEVSQNFNAGADRKIVINEFLINPTGDDEIEPSGEWLEFYNISDTSGPENKSYNRIPDGVGVFVDPIPTPLYPNIIEEEIFTGKNNINTDEHHTSLDIITEIIPKIEPEDIIIKESEGIKPSISKITKPDNSLESPVIQKSKELGIEKTEGYVDPEELPLSASPPKEISFVSKNITEKVKEPIAEEATKELVVIG